MEYRRLGRTALEVSELCLGTMNFGPNTTEPEAFAILDLALEAGINFVDTADQYGGQLGVGATEGIIGRWLAQGGGRRERIVLATKLYEPMSERPNDRGLSARHIRRACDASLRRLQTDHIDLYQMHHLDRTAPWDEVWQAMETLVAQGKITYVGSSNFAGWTIAQANEAARARHFLGLVSEQSLYNLTERTVELEVIPACQSYGLALLPWSPLAGGLLGGVLSNDSTGRRSSAEMRQRVDSRRPQLERWEADCATNSAMPRAKLRWPGCCTGPASRRRSSGHARSSSSAAPWRLPRSASTTDSWAGSTRSSPDPARHPRRTPGSVRASAVARALVLGPRREWLDDVAGRELLGRVHDEESGQPLGVLGEFAVVVVRDARSQRLAEPWCVELDVGNRPQLVGQIRGAAVPRPHVADLYGPGGRRAHRAEPHPLGLFLQRRIGLSRVLRPGDLAGRSVERRLVGRQEVDAHVRARQVARRRCGLAGRGTS